MNLHKVNELLAETIYEIGAGGLRPIKTSGILIQPNVTYHMGASSSPHKIFVTKVDDRMIYYRSYPFYRGREARIDRGIGTDLILQGVNTFMKSGYGKYPWGKATIRKYKSLLAGKKVKPEDLKDYQRIKVTVGPGKGYEGKDLWREAESHGYGVGGRRVEGMTDGFPWMKNDNSSVYEIEMDKKSLPGLKKDKRFKILSIKEM